MVIAFEKSSFVGNGLKIEFLNVPGLMTIAIEVKESRFFIFIFYHQ